MNSPLFSVLEAQHQILDVALLGSVVPTYFENALGETLGADLVAPSALPSFANSAMDGYLIHPSDASETPFSLPGTFEIPAGTTQIPQFSKRTCARIMTGAPLPDFEVLIIPIEWTTQNGESITFHRLSQSGQFVRNIGEDVQIGKVIGKAQQNISPFDLGLWASVGITEVPIRPKPTISLFSTGNEIIPPTLSPRFGEVRNANLYALSAQIQQHGGALVHRSHLKDDFNRTEELLEWIETVDIAIFSGGVSMGKYDFIRPMLDKLGWHPRFWKVAQRPGKPLAFGTLGKTLIFGLPGNPVSSTICFDQYVRPAIRKMKGLSPFRPQTEAVLGERIKKSSDLHVFWRAKPSPSGLVSAGAQGSHVYSVLQHTTHLVHLPVGQSVFEIGESVWCETFE